MTKESPICPACGHRHIITCGYFVLGKKCGCARHPAQMPSLSQTDGANLSGAYADTAPAGWTLTAGRLERTDA